MEGEPPEAEEGGGGAAGVVGHGVGWAWRDGSVKEDGHFAGSGAHSGL